MSFNCSNPIFIEYYSHLDCNCYKIKNPWTKYKEEVIVLCPVKDGYEKARDAAKRTLTTCLEDAIFLPPYNSIE